MRPNHSSYIAHILLDSIKDQFKLKNDKELSVFIGISVPTISRVRNNHHKLTETMILRIHEATDWPSVMIRDLYHQQLIINSKTNRGKS